MNGLTAADFADTGQWRLTVEISKEGIGAWLENLLRTDIERQLLFESKWKENDEALLSNIENAVYDHPRVLDDFSAKIILFDRNTLFIPTDLAERGEINEEECYSDVFNVDPENVITEQDKDLIACFSLINGLKSFLLRTFPGARITSNLMDKVKRYRKEGEYYEINCDVRENEADFIFLHNTNLISASTHSWSAPSDVIYLLFNLMEVYNINPQDVKIKVRGLKFVGEEKDFIKSRMREFIEIESEK